MNFPQEGNAIHGLLYTSRFTVFKRNVSKSGASLVLRFVYLGSEQGFPFHFRTTITYALTPRGFVCTTRVQNIGETAMPFGDGWHPYFALLSPVDHLALQLPIVKRLAVRKMIPTGATIPYDAYKNSRQIGGAVFDTGFVIQKKTGRAVTALIDPKDGTKCSLWQEVGREKYSYLQVYIPPDRKSIALEPMTCACNAFNNKMGLIVLQSGKTFSAKYGVTLSSVSTTKQK
jgi:aldose 1-epimerase